VLACKNNEVVEEYNGSNSRLDSMQSVSLKSLACLSLYQIREMAQKTAYDMAKAHSIPAKYVGEDPDAKNHEFTK